MLLLPAALALSASADSAPTRTAATSGGGVPRATHVVLIVLENKERGDVVGNPDAAALAGLARRYAQLTNYTAVAHPSLPNYLALVSGSTDGITSDCTDCTVSTRSLADTLEQAGESWKAYAEGLPSPGYAGAHAGRYAKKHVPFLYFRDVLAKPRRLKNIVPLTQFGSDLRSGMLPNFSLVVPDLCHDMHDCSVATGDKWLGSFLPPLVRSRTMRRAIVFVVFDEGTSDEGGGGRVQALVIGPLVRSGAQDTHQLNHYGLLHTIELSLGLRLLGTSASAEPILGIWRTG